ncbi:GNAT family N-acetyltransferase [Streptomyces sp. AJS327]|uniref:bifunctional acetate--CoA ligase family protein/GNAT family N-acetyltransferase n=1 Tax=Streptomyces sp. AJS327 TaxID=2545265 RepID=UPI0015DE8DAF|nr:bifunctional GNAT family N-acetyltransferase/acetate--CoA ligase family protein [Streptomyces sp. AJS327]MBA0051992.1 GNAT family N-acetyltransferase [Streptomyces sp. AJS327]
MPTAEERAYPAHWEADVLLRDGGAARIRPITPDDADRLVDFYEQVSDESKYYRFFAPYPRLSDRDVRRFTHHDYDDRVGLAATVGGEFIATVRYDRVDDAGRAASAPADQAEVAFLVRDDHQGRGVASALLEHIGAVARERGIRRFTAEVLPANNRMIKVFTDAGYSQRRSFEDGSVHLTFSLEPTERSLAVMRAREQRAEAHSVQRLLAPGSVAVVGVRRTPDGAGRAVLDGLREAGFTGRVHAVNQALPPEAGRLGGFPAVRSVNELPEAPDLVVVAVPAPAVVEVVTDCGELGVRGLVVLSAEFGREDQRELVRLARSYGMRLVGPNALGLINTHPEIRLNATPAPRLPRAGRVGLFTQSGAIGIALLDGLHRRGAGLSSFVSAGNRADVSGNDVLQYWDEDPETDVALMYLESIGNPRKFSRLAKRTAARKPVVVVKGARHSGSAPPPGHAAPVFRTSAATVSSLLRNAGVTMVDTVTELVDTGLLLATQPLPDGPRVAIVGNAESLGLLTYDAALTEELRPLPVTDLTTSATPGDFGRAVRAALTDPASDAVVVTAIPWVGAGSGDTTAEHRQEEAAARRLAAELAEAVRSAAEETGRGKPLAVAHLAIEGLDTALAEHGIPGYPAPERAARALSEASRYAAWRRAASDPGRVPEYEVDEPGARALLERATRAEKAEPEPPGAAGTGRTGTPATPGGERPSSGLPLSLADTASLLGRYGIEVHPVREAPDADAAAAAARDLGYPVALKTTAPHLRHRADLGGVRLDLAGESELRHAYAELTAAFGSPAELRPVVQAMAPRGVDTVVRAAVDPSVGAMLSFGLAGTPSALLGDTAHRLVPVTDREAGALVRAIRSAPLLFGWRGASPSDTAALEELLLRVSMLLDDHPEIVAVDLEPVVVAPRGVAVLDAAVRVAEPPPRTDLGPRTLPVY